MNVTYSSDKDDPFNKYENSLWLPTLSMLSLHRMKTVLIVKKKKKNHTYWQIQCCSESVSSKFNVKQILQRCH